jgi:hypothetical protein
VKRFRLIGGWVALGCLCLVYLAVPELRPGLRSVLGLGYLLVLWFFLARTKTLSWQSVAGLFALGLPWSLLVASLARLVTAGPGQSAVDDLGARTAIAAVLEPSLVLLPLLLLTVLNPVRVRRFSVNDWLLAGFALGLSYQAVEELARLDGAHADYGFGPLSGGTVSAMRLDGQFAGRAGLAALTAVTIGLAVAAWRHAGKSTLGQVTAIVWRVVAVLAPLGCWWLTVSAQAGWNAGLVVGDRWLSTDDPSVPWILRSGWQLGRHGAAPALLLIALFLVALLVDAGRLRNAAEHADDPLPYPFAPTAAADQWAGRLTRWAGTRTAWPVAAAVWLIAAGCAVIAYAVRDLVVLLVAPGRPDRSANAGARATTPEGERRTSERESLWTSIARVRQAGVMVRTIRAEAIAVAAGADTPHTRRFARLIGALGLVGVLLATFWLAPHWAGGIGDSVISGGLDSASATAGPDAVARTAWLAGTVSTFGSWWGSLAIWEYLLLGLGFVALTLFSVGPLDPAGFGGHSVWLDARAPSGDRPVDRVRSYLGQAGPMEVAVDAVGAALSLLPARVVRSATGEEVRRAVHQFAAAPSTFVADRRAAARSATRHSPEPVTAGATRPRDDTELPAVKLADGRLLAALSPDEERMFVAEIADLTGDVPAQTAREQSPEDAYRERIYGADQRLISLRPQIWSDGQNTAYGMVGDVYYYDGRGSSWYVPQTLPEAIRHKANLELDRRLIEFATVVYYPASPFRALEITTNHPLVAHALEERMSRLAIPGYVVVEA